MNIIEYIKGLQNISTKKAASTKAVVEAEAALHLTFSDEYKEYTRVFGAICIDTMQLTGCVSVPEANVVIATNSGRTITEKAKESWYVIYDALIDGLIYWQDSNGDVYETIPGKEPKKVAKSMVDFLMNC